MTERSEQVHPSEIFGGKFRSTIQRIGDTYDDENVHMLGFDIMDSTGDERSGLEAQLVVYLAARYALFPEESKIITDSLREDNGFAEFESIVAGQFPDTEVDTIIVIDPRKIGELDSRLAAYLEGERTDIFNRIYLELVAACGGDKELAQDVLHGCIERFTQSKRQLDG
ncbi:MAG TPA: hypothetical protein VFB03_00520 [Candidatus Saccharimonadales bacterium]|nr:hypothetical protein [Candidatus Saccharimonadales bacterium]